METTDTNRYGIVINVNQQDDKMILTLIAERKTYNGSNLGMEKRSSPH
ncbi:hypothetical protein [uncultured Croceitalea sp.]